MRRTGHRAAPHLAVLTADTTAPVVDDTAAAAAAAHALFNAVLRAARETASDDYDLMLEAQGMDTPDALAALKNAFLLSDMIEPIADALNVLAPRTYAPRPTAPARSRRHAPPGGPAAPARGAEPPPGSPRLARLAGLRCLASARPSSSLQPRVEQ
ncbi:hypothetical protein ACFW9F_16260 [Streptomyces sp. NPDC059506]|uniref:hypothetical protein n=1 Tax=Streptomyces sp. NPDC059506 TaxID=3347751 RepID=UPI0036C06D44